MSRDLPPALSDFKLHYEHIAPNNRRIGLEPRGRRLVDWLGHMAGRTIAWAGVASRAAARQLVAITKYISRSMTKWNNYINRKLQR